MPDGKFAAPACKGCLNVPQLLCPLGLANAQRTGAVRHRCSVWWPPATFSKRSFSYFDSRVPVGLVRLPWRRSNDAYKQGMTKVVARAQQRDVTGIASGDLLLEDFRAYCER
jgi:hypothetical protein